jgi:hypothetical protein
VDNKDEEALTRTGDNGYHDGENRYEYFPNPEICDGGGGGDDKTPVCTLHHTL